MGQTLEPMEPDISIVIPTFNEMARLPQTLREIIPFLEGLHRDFEVIIVDDNSPDGTASFSSKLAASDPRIRVIVQPRRLGKGAAIRRGCLGARGAFVLFMDADHATPIQEIAGFLSAAEQGADAVVGVRTYQEGESKWRRILGMFAQILAHLLVFERAVFDSQCGFKMFTRAAVREIFPYCRVDGGMIDVEIFFVIHNRGLSCIYRPVHWVNKAGSRVNILRCMFTDTIELLRIRARRIAKVYSRPVVERNQPWLRG